MFEGRLGQALGPWGLLGVGIVAGIMASPALRKGAHRLAVLTVCGALSITDQVKKASGGVRKAAGGAKGHLGKLVDEARMVGAEKTAPAVTADE
jgi:hypothetical protein